VKKGSQLAPLLLLCFNIAAQETFSVKFDLGSGTAASAVIETSDGFLVCGSGYDTTGINHPDFFIHKLNKNVETISLFQWGEEEYELRARNKTHGTFADSTHIIAVLLVQPGPNECMLL